MDIVTYILIGSSRECRGSDVLLFLIGCYLLFIQQKDDVSLSEGSTVDLRKPGEEEDEYSEMAEEAMDPDNCFPDSKRTHTHT